MEAGVSGDRKAALMAMLINPLMPSFGVARQLLGEMLEANREYLSLSQSFPQTNQSV